VAARLRLRARRPHQGAAPATANLLRAPARWRGQPDPFTPALREAVAAFHAQAIGREDAFVARFRALARELDLAIALTYLERWQGPPRNSVSLIDRHGEIAFTTPSCTPATSTCRRRR
jgi:hypothetical protein